MNQSIGADSPFGGRRAGNLQRADLWDVAFVIGVGILVLAAAFIGYRLESTGEPINAGAPPLQGLWDFRLGVGTALAPLIAVVVVTYGVSWVRRARWAALWPMTWVLTAAWGLAVAWIDPWSRGITEPLLSRYDYLVAVPRVDDLGAFFEAFTRSVPIDSATAWPTHVAGHPPVALLPFVLLDRVGLGGPGPAATLIVVLGASVSVALLVATRALVDLDAARRLAPFGMLAPGVIWSVVSADALFAAVVGWAVALTALACTTTGRRADIAAVCGGLAIGLSMYLSYGMVLALGIGAAVLLSRGRWRTLLLVVLGVFVVVLVVTLSGFSWLDGYSVVVDRYYDGLGGVRPYSYWVWANLAAFSLAIGPAAIVGARRAGAAVVASTRGSPGWPSARATLRSPVGSTALVTASALACVVAATLGGLSSGEVERIWLPFGAWVLFAAIAIPRNRTRLWLSAQAIVVIVLAHIALTPW
ncbi:MAG: hypothetical protein LH645_05890 [Actinomycetia bacterium]|nr:hypothetical protein [Actinomycetes bacterium]